VSSVESEGRITEAMEMALTSLSKARKERSEAGKGWGIRIDRDVEGRTSHFIAAVVVENEKDP